jgi:probable LLM family oxidoreductase
MELGLVTFADLYEDPDTRQPVAPERRMRELLEEVRLADEVGLDVFGIGEHHRADYLVSSPTTALAAAAAQTRRIRLSSAVTVLSSEDPVRVFQQFSTVDLISGGRAEIMAGRGSFTESFPLFGQDLQDYDELFAEKLDLLLRLREGGPVTWQGRHRPPLEAATIYPRPVQDPLPVWIAVGGTPQSVARAGLLGLPLAIAIIGGAWTSFEPLVGLHRRAVDEGRRQRAEAGEQVADAGVVPVAINTHGLVARTEHEAVDAFFPSWAAMMTRIGRERGWPPTTRRQFDQMRTPDGALMIGSPEQVAEKILAQHERLGHQRYLLHSSLGAVRHADVLRSIELLGTEVAPIVRAELARRAPAVEAPPAPAGPAA